VVGPVETAMGFHLVQVVDRRPERPLELSENMEIDGNPMPVRDIVRNNLLQRKLEKELEKYVKGLKDKAVIEVVGTKN
jgi:parvulin-like peptidyl-prolyl isomerase